MGGSSSPDLSTFITPTLLRSVLAFQFPWSRSKPLDIPYIAHFLFGAGPDAHVVFDTCHHTALKPIAQLGGASVAQLRNCLPDPQSNEFPELCMGLIVLLDQGPRVLYRGMDMRWTNALFDEIVQAFVRDLVETGDIPDDTQRWIKLGYSFEDVLIRKMWLYTPLIHSERWDDHILGRKLTPSMRLEVESYCGHLDPHRTTFSSDSKDVLLFKSLVTNDPPETFDTFLFWVYRVFLAHDPIIETYGRYPYRTQLKGLLFTPTEEKWLKDNDNFAMPKLTEAEIRRLQELARTGEWDELSDKGPW